MRLRTAVLALAPPIAFLAVAPAATQDSRDSVDALTSGRRALSFTLLNGGGAGLGIWKVTAPDRARGVFVNGSAHFIAGNSGGATSKGAGISLSAGPQFRRYLARSGPVLPFAQSGFSLSGACNWSNNDDSFSGGVSNHEWSTGLEADMGIGAEWFPLRRASLAGRTGLSGNVGYSRDSVTPSSQSSQSSHNWNVSPDTFVSSVTLQLYF
jgi:hypothetical protein